MPWLLYATALTRRPRPAYETTQRLGQRLRIIGPVCDLSGIYLVLCIYLVLRKKYMGGIPSPGSPHSPLTVLSMSCHCPVYVLSLSCRCRTLSVCISNLSPVQVPIPVCPKREGPILSVSTRRFRFRYVPKGKFRTIGTCTGLRLEMYTKRVRQRQDNDRT